MYVCFSLQNQNFALRLQHSVLANGNSGGVSSQTRLSGDASSHQTNDAHLPEGLVAKSAGSPEAANAVSKDKKFNIIPSIFGGGSNNERPTEYLDEGAYIAAATIKPGGDAYSKNKFNQAESDRLASNRAVPDTRNQM